jgi:excisionase family DNA binding protein
MSQENPQTHLTVAQLAHRWGVSQNLVRRLIWDKVLASARFGRAVRVPIEEAERYAVEASKKPPIQRPAKKDPKERQAPTAAKKRPPPGSTSDGGSQRKPKVVS